MHNNTSIQQQMNRHSFTHSHCDDDDDETNTYHHTATVSQQIKRHYSIEEHELLDELMGSPCFNKDQSTALLTTNFDQNKRNASSNKTNHSNHLNHYNTILNEDRDQYKGQNRLVSYSDDRNRGRYLSYNSQGYDSSQINHHQHEQQHEQQHHHYEQQQHHEYQYEKQPLVQQPHLLKQHEYEYRPLQHQQHRIPTHWMNNESNDHQDSIQDESIAWNSYDHHTHALRQPFQDYSNIFHQKEIIGNKNVIQSGTFQKKNQQSTLAQRFNHDQKSQINKINSNAGLNNTFHHQEPQKSQQNHYSLHDKPSNQVSVMELPQKYRVIYNFKTFNDVQSNCYSLIMNSQKNLVVSSPTGSGKTCLMELAIIRLLHSKDGATGKIIYMAPTKALCSERTRDWKAKFERFGITCNELTGDTHCASVNEVQKSNIIITTPEKWFVFCLYSTLILGIQ